MGEILFLAHRVPFPPDRGDKIRSHHLLRGLAGIAPVHVGTFADTPGDREQEAVLSNVAASHLVVSRKKPMALAGLEALATGRPVSLTAFADRRLHEWVARTLAERPIDTIFVFSGQMGQYVPDDFPGRVIVDLCDADSAKFGTYAQTAAWPRSALLRREDRLLREEEARLAERADKTLLITAQEKGLFASRLPDPGDARLAALGNGIDANFFDPAYAGEEPTIAARKGPHIVFTGQMDYPPNVAAALRGIARILPLVRRRFPEAEFHVVGRAPARELAAHDGRDGVTIWGEVVDVRPFLLAAAVVIAPLDLARGVQNKVLEAMAMCRPVVASEEAATGIAATDGTHFAIARSDAQMAEEIVALIEDGAKARRMGRMARGFVLREYSWASVHEELRRIVGADANRSGRDAA
ncbi:TIGR03087 family PEP-CTERM/XrtA system glycosyltransferase [Qipengyuania spongiae]|uniref:TIGR03087 family PEP-CTERM/XrtA system glycosyltransferase n=1 Tax=Qipengyuania spongiae TaxID=2909673 RepID=A0ABY5SXN5_9SPHN|nr:TIGR03087 family PEP-CTERM/XrtA system glycosyltransferase [Qipengyuania spongiae]UVI38984.1 TIGR03087 family PEP-CTERM/XrtA system glycosyltransferase [Qipengyuania spongiae]